MHRRVVITGTGVVSPIGVGVKKFTDALFAGKNGVGRITHFDPSAYRSQIAGEAEDFDPLRYLSSKEVKRMDSFTQFGMVAAEEALQQAGLETEKEDPTRIGVLIGSGVGGV